MAVWLSFALLGLSICALWLAPLKITRAVSATPWMILFVMACACAAAAGVITASGLAALALLGGAAYITGDARFGRALRIAAGIVTTVLALALALHKLPGFANPQLVANLRLTADAVPYTQYANFDKGAVGLLLLAFLCPRAATAAEWRALLRRSAPIALFTLAGVMGVALAIGVVRPAFKWSDYTIVFLATNLLFTCVAEEAFFRGLVQGRLAAMRPDSRLWQVAVLALSAILFGLAHLGGGTAYAALATLCGVGYAYAFAATRRIEAAILTHFGFNALHFVAFTYPALAPSVNP